MPLIRSFRCLAILFTISVLIIIGCDDDPTSSGDIDGPDDEPTIELTADEAAQIVYEYLIEMGWIPSEESQSKTVPFQSAEFEGDKFIEVEETDTGNIILRLYYDESGKIIPNSEWYSDNPHVCGDQFRLNKPSKRILEIEIDLSSMVMKMELINAESNQTIKSHESEIFVEDDWFIEMLEEMFLEFDDEEIFGVFDTECGLFEGPIKIYFDSGVEAEVITPEHYFFMNSAVQAEIQLEYSEDSEQYVGQAPLVHRTYESSLISEFGCSVTLTDAVMRVELDVENFVTISDLNLYITDPVSGANAPSASVICGEDFGNTDSITTIWFPVYVIFHQDNVDSEREVFWYTDWEESEDSNVIGVLEFENAADFTDFDDSFDGAESMPVTEQTRIEIRPNP